MVTEARGAKYEYWPPVLYPVTISVCVGLYYLLRAAEASLLTSAYTPVALGATVITFFELYTPHLKSWIADRKEVWNDALFMVIVQMVLPKTLTFLAALALLQMSAAADCQARGLWPHGWPLGAQVVLMILVADFLRYWLHRFSHEWSPLWKLHAVHHSPKKLYWFNVGRFHPVEKALQFQVDALPFIAVGVAAEVLSLYFVFYAVNGFFQHCNVELRMGPLNYLISGPQLHRWHHSRKPTEANNNYGNNIIIWDLFFGTYFFPRTRLVQQLGLLNEEYPLDFPSQLKTPFAGNIESEAAPLRSVRELAINQLLKLKMVWIGAVMYRPLLRAAGNPSAAQAAVLVQIMRANAGTEYGKKHGFARVVDHRTLMKEVPVCVYENLRPYIERQDKEGVAALTAEMPRMYNQTSGTTGTPKYIPVHEQTLAALRRSQQTFSFVQYRSRPEAFSGKMLGIVSPPVEGFLESGTPYGSASGHIYEMNPRLTQAKYVVPIEVFAIDSYDIKYYVICRLAVEEKDITYLGSANPSTFHKLLETIRAKWEQIVADIEAGACAHLQELPEPAATTLRDRLKPNPGRAQELRGLFAGTEAADFTAIWPYLKLLTTWTRGSCAISLNSILPMFPPGIGVTDAGYLASELRGTVTIDASNAGLPTLQENFFEFVEKELWEGGNEVFLGLGDLEIGREYYLFVTTPAGLYRYDMNDIVEVTGIFQQTPTIAFVQKGKGATNITGEKLYESQVIVAMQRAEGQFALDVRHYQVLANEASSRYELYLELVSTSGNVGEEEVAAYVDEALQEINIEYATKRGSDRLKQLVVTLLRQGTYERYKEHCLNSGRAEGQFKGVLLSYARDLDFDLERHRVPR